jgi:hypothetical protein
MLWVYNELPIRSIFITSLNSAKAFHILDQALSFSFENDMYIISANKERIIVPVNAVNATYINKILSPQFECPGFYWAEL